MEPKTVAILGAGSRGGGFGEICAAVPQLAKVVAVAEPRNDFRKTFSTMHQISPDRQFRGWQNVKSMIAAGGKGIGWGVNLVGTRDKGPGKNNLSTVNLSLTVAARMVASL